MSSFGDELRRERELREISLREISDATKISQRYLQALETNAFENLPGGVFNRGFVRAYSEFIGIDPEAMVNAYLMEEQTRSNRGKHQDGQLLRRSRDAHRTPPIRDGETRPWLKWGLWILIGAALAAGLFVAVRYVMADADVSRLDGPAQTGSSESAATVDRRSIEHE